MTAILTDQRHIILPPEMDQAVQALPSRRFDVTVSESGVIMLRPERKHHKTLVEHLRGLQGVEIERRRDPIPPPIEL